MKPKTSIRVNRTYGVCTYNIYVADKKEYLLYTKANSKVHVRLHHNRTFVGFSSSPIETSTPSHQHFLYLWFKGKSG